MNNISRLTIFVIWLNTALCFQSIVSNENSIDKILKRDISTIEVKGNKFFYSDSGKQFFMRGIAYQQLPSKNEDRVEEIRYIDPLANSSTCLRDLEYFEDLNINLLRVYQIDPNANHDTCMKAFADAGIYVLVDLSEPDLSINRDSPSWDIDLLKRYTAVIDSLHKYNNILGFFSGNEVTNSKENTEASPFVKAAIRDTKAYIKRKGYRRIPVGYATNDDVEIRDYVSNYFICGPSIQEEAADFFGINIYEWCGYSSYVSSGYRDRTLEYKDFPVPAFFSEYGCNDVTPRHFTEVEALYNPTMSKVWSGGIAYSYFEGDNHYGIIEENKNGTVTKLVDYDNLKYQLNKVQPQGIEIDEDDSIKNDDSVQCIPQDEIWKASDSLPETPDTGKCECLQTALSCVITPHKHIDEISLLKEICSYIDCSEIVSDSSQGCYGRFASCSQKQRLSYALNKLYILNNRNPEYCDFDSQAVLITNSNSIDLDVIYSNDGRTCTEALGGELDYSNKKDAYTNGNKAGVTKAKASNASTLSNKKGIWNHLVSLTLYIVYLVYVL